MFRAPIPNPKAFPSLRWKKHVLSPLSLGWRPSSCFVLWSHVPASRRLNRMSPWFCLSMGSLAHPQEHALGRTQWLMSYWHDQVQGKFQDIPRPIWSSLMKGLIQFGEGSWNFSPPGVFYALTEGPKKNLGWCKGMPWGTVPVLPGKVRVIYGLVDGAGWMRSASLWRKRQGKSKAWDRSDHGGDPWACEGQGCFEARGTYSLDCGVLPSLIKSNIDFISTTKLPFL